MFGVGTPSVDLTRLGRTLSLTIAAVACAAATALVMAGLVSGNSNYLAQATVVTVVAGFAGLQALTRRGHICHVLGVAAASIMARPVLFGPVAGKGPGPASAVALIVVGMTASLFVTRHLIRYLAGYGCFIAVAHLLWRWGDWDAAFVDGLLGVAIFVLGALVFIWLRNELGRNATQYRWLLDSTPVTIRIEDFSRVGTWLEGLRAAGVTDLRGWLAADREHVLQGVRKTEVVDVNAAGVAMLEAADASELLGPIPESGVTEESLASFVEQFVAIWENVDHLTLEVPGGAAP